MGANRTRKSSRYSPRETFYSALFIFCATQATVLTPLAAMAGLGPLLAMRAMMGIGEGVAMPAMNSLLSSW